MSAHASWRMLLATLAIQEISEGGEQLPNPVAIGVTLGGLLLDVVFPRPKPRAGPVHEPSLSSPHPVPRTPRYAKAVDEYERRPVVGAGRS
jgi:hypothetical protein